MKRKVLTRAERREEFRKDVELMRELGVARWGATFLGPPPPPKESKMTDEDRARRAAELADKQHETLFAASSVRPRLPGATVPPVPRGVEPRGITPRLDRGQGSHQ